MTLCNRSQSQRLSPRDSLVSVSTSPILTPPSWVPPALLGEEGGDCGREHGVLSRAPAGAAPSALSLHNLPRTLPAQMPARQDCRRSKPNSVVPDFSAPALQALCPELSNFEQREQSVEDL